MITNIVVSKETRSKLCKLGRKEQTYDNIINELIRIKEASGLGSRGLIESTKQSHKVN